jgi:hypothetical protein
MILIFLAFICGVQEWGRCFHNIFNGNNFDVEVLGPQKTSIDSFLRTHSTTIKSGLVLQSSGQVRPQVYASKCGIEMRPGGGGLATRTSSHCSMQATVCVCACSQKPAQALGLHRLDMGHIRVVNGFPKPPALLQVPPCPDFHWPYPNEYTIVISHVHTTTLSHIVIDLIAGVTWFASTAQCEKLCN